MTEFLNISNLTCELGGKKLLDSVSFSLEKGEYLSLVGPNGAGKTTLLRVVARIIAKYQGDVKLEGRELGRISNRELASYIGYVPQLFYAEFPYTVFEFVLMGLYSELGRFSPVSSSHLLQIEEVLVMTDTAHLSGRAMQSLSGGERQRVLIAAALVHKPKILLLDEPTTFLDPKHEFEVEHLLGKVRHSLGLSILAVTHNLNLCALNSDKIIALRDGRLVFSGKPQEFMLAETLSRVFDHQFELVRHPQRDFNMIVPRSV